jgi:hypothetical protein
MPVKTTLKLRRDTAANWTSTNPTLATGEPGFETDTGRIKIGDGSTAWTSLHYSGESVELDYVEVVSNVTVTSTNSSSPTTVVDGNAISLNGSTSIKVEFYSPTTPAGSGVAIGFKLYDGATDLGCIGWVGDTSGGDPGDAIYFVAFLRGSRIPSNASHTYHIKAYHTSSPNPVIQAGAGGAGTNFPLWYRVTTI